MKRLLALLCVFLFLTAGCAPLDWAISLIEKETEGDSLPETADPEESETPEEPEEPEVSKNLTIIFAGETEDDRTGLLEAASQLASAEGYTLSAVNSMGDTTLEQRFLELAAKAGEQAVLLELADPEQAEDAVKAAGGMTVIFVKTQPARNSALSKRAIFVGNAEGEGEQYLRLTGRTAMRAACNLISGTAADEGTELRLSGNKITVPADGMLKEK